MEPLSKYDINMRKANHNINFLIYKQFLLLCIETEVTEEKNFLSGMNVALFLNGPELLHILLHYVFLQKINFVMSMIED